MALRMNNGQSEERDSSERTTRDVRYHPDVRLKPNAVNYLIEPTAGKGKAWIDGDQVRIVGWSE